MIWSYVLELPAVIQPNALVRALSLAELTASRSEQRPSAATTSDVVVTWMVPADAGEAPAAQTRAKAVARPAIRSAREWRILRNLCATRWPPAPTDLRFLPVSDRLRA